MSNDPFTFGPEERGFMRVSDDDSDALYATNESRDATGDVARVEYAARGSDLSGYRAQRLKLDSEGKIIGKETFGRRKDTRAEAVEGVESMVRNRTAANFGGFEIGEFNVGDDGDIGLARRAHLSRSQEAQASDAAKRAPVTTNASRYASQPGELDYPGVDTPSTDPNVLPKDLRQEQRPATTDAPEPAQMRTQPPETPTVEKGTQAPEPLTTGLFSQDVSLSPEEAFEGVGRGDPGGATGVEAGARVDEQRRLGSGRPPAEALDRQGRELEAERRERAAEQAGVLDTSRGRAGSDLFDLSNGVGGTGRADD
jgi:hypothetical protein